MEGVLGLEEFFFSVVTAVSLVWEVLVFIWSFFSISIFLRAGVVCFSVFDIFFGLFLSSEGSLLSSSMSASGGGVIISKTILIGDSVSITCG